MIDPITAVAMATSAFKTVQKMVSMGREIEDTLGQVGKWYGAVSDLTKLRGKQRIHLSFAGWQRLSQSSKKRQRCTRTISE